MSKEEQNRYYNLKSQAEKKTKEEDEYFSEDDALEVDNFALNQRIQSMQSLETMNTSDDLDLQYESDNENKKLMQNYYVND